MKIAYVLGEYPSLSETFIAREIEALRRRGFEINIWAFRAGEGAGKIASLSPGLRGWAKATRSGGEWWRRAGSKWAKGARDKLEGAEHVHAGWASYPAWVAWGAAEALGVPWSFSGHARDLWVEGEGLQEKLQAAKFASCCTSAGTEHLKSLSPELKGKVLYAPHGIDLNFYEFQERREPGDVVEVLSVGRLVEKKGFPVLLRALCEVVESGHRVGGQIIGEGPQRPELEKQIAKIQWNDELRLTGAYSHAQVITAMQSADLFVMPSTHATDGDRDGLPNVLLEAAACGLPIVSTSAGSIGDFLDESCAWLCESDNAGVLAQAIINAIENYDESLQRAKVARVRVEQNFNIEKNIEILANAFKESAFKGN